jgi:hypothetical protein
LSRLRDWLRGSREKAKEFPELPVFWEATPF